MASMCGKRLNYLTDGFTMLEMTKEFAKRLKYVEMTYVCGKWLKCLING